MASEQHVKPVELIPARSARTMFIMMIVPRTLEIQLATLRAAAPTQQPVDQPTRRRPLDSGTPASSNADAVEGRVRAIGLPDDWYLQKQKKMQTNEALMPTDLLKKSYLQNRTSGNAFAQLKPYYKSRNPRLWKGARVAAVLPLPTTRSDCVGE